MNSKVLTVGIVTVAGIGGYLLLKPRQSAPSDIQTAAKRVSVWDRYNNLWLSRKYLYTYSEFGTQYGFYTFTISLPGTENNSNENPQVVMAVGKNPDTGKWTFEFGPVSGASNQNNIYLDGVYKITLGASAGFTE